MKPVTVMAFVGALESVLDLRRRIRGLETPDKQSNKLDVARDNPDDWLKPSSPRPHHLIGLLDSGGQISKCVRRGRDRRPSVKDRSWKERSETSFSRPVMFFLWRPITISPSNWRNRSETSISCRTLMRADQCDMNARWTSLVILRVALVFLLIFKPFNLSAVPAVWLCALLMVLTRCVIGHHRQTIDQLAGAAGHRCGHRNRKGHGCQWCGERHHPVPRYPMP